MKQRRNVFVFRFDLECLHMRECRKCWREGVGNRHNNKVELSVSLSNDDAGYDDLNLSGLPSGVHGLTMVLS